MILLKVLQKVLHLKVIPPQQLELSQIIQLDICVWMVIMKKKQMVKLMETSFEL
jgi:hypothetical protein